MKRKIKNISRTKIGRKIFILSGNFLLYILSKTYRYQSSGTELFSKNIGKRPIILVFWHGRILGMQPFIKNDIKHPCYATFSKSEDGQLMSKLMSNKYLRTIAGSTSNGGTQALRSIFRHLKNNGIFGIAPDGPTGPRFSITTDSIFFLAKKTNAIIFPVIIGGNNVKVINSWDKFFLFKPFSKIIVKVCKPMVVKSNSSYIEIKKIKNKLEKVLIEGTQKLDKKTLGIKIKPQHTEKDRINKIKRKVRQPNANK